MTGSVNLIIQGSKTFVSLNPKIESSKEEEKDQSTVSRSQIDEEEWDVDVVDGKDVKHVHILTEIRGTHTVI